MRSLSSRSLKQYMLEKTPDEESGRKKGSILKRPAKDEGDIETAKTKSKGLKGFLGGNKEKKEKQAKELTEEKQLKRSAEKKTESWGRKEGEKIKAMVKLRDSGERKKSIEPTLVSSNSSNSLLHLYTRPEDSPRRTTFASNTKAEDDKGSMRRRSHTNPAVPLAVISAVAGLSTEKEIHSTRSQIISRDSPRTERPNTYVEDPAVTTKSSPAPSPDSSPVVLSSPPLLHSPRSGKSGSDLPRSSGLRSSKESLPDVSPQSSPRSPKRVTLHEVKESIVLLSPTPVERSFSTSAIGRTNSAPSSPSQMREATSHRQSKMRASSKRDTKRKRISNKVEERRKNKEREIMGEEAYALTFKINQSLLSLLANVFELDYGEVMKLRTNVREWTGEVDRCVERMRKEFS